MKLFSIYYTLLLKEKKNESIKEVINDKIISSVDDTILPYTFR